jgi:hypothetical protein
MKEKNRASFFSIKNYKFRPPPKLAKLTSNRSNEFGKKHYGTTSNCQKQCCGSVRYVFGPAGSGLARHTDPSKIQQK